MLKQTWILTEARSHGKYHHNYYHRRSLRGLIDTQLLFFSAKCEGSRGQVKICEVGGEGLFLPLFGDAEQARFLKMFFAPNRNFLGLVLVNAKIIFRWLQVIAIANQNGSSW